MFMMFFFRVFIIMYQIKNARRAIFSFSVTYTCIKKSENVSVIIILYLWIPTQHKSNIACLLPTYKYFQGIIHVSSSALFFS